jgi:hypothetical protein
LELYPKSKFTTFELLSQIHLNGFADPATGVPMKKRYWLTPPALYKSLDTEFRFDHDPCPFPHVEGYNGVAGAWGRSNFVNPPFRRDDIKFKAGPTAFVRKAIEEQKLGRTSVLLLPTTLYTNLLIEAGAEFRSCGRLRWVECVDGTEYPNPGPVMCAILKPKPKTGEE